MRSVSGLFGALALVVLSGCQLAGPEAILTGRPQYNEAINVTSSRQLLTNLVRVYQNESPFSLEVNSITAATTATGSLTGTASSLGVLPAGSVTPTLSYSEQPSITYQPINGDSLVQEFATPVPITLVSRLYAGTWPLLPLLEMIVSKLTDNDEDYGAAINDFAALDARNALQLVAISSGSAKGGENTAKDSNKDKSKDSGTSTSDANALAVYFIPPTNCEDRKEAFSLWRDLLRFYGSRGGLDARQTGTIPFRHRLQCPDVDKEMAATRGVVELNTLPRPALSQSIAGVQETRPLLATFSAYAILRGITEGPDVPAEIVQVASLERYRTIRTEVWNRSGQRWYTLLYSDVCGLPPGVPATNGLREATFRCKQLSDDSAQMNSDVDRAIMASPMQSRWHRPELMRLEGDTQMQDNLNQRRRMILILASDTAPDRPFVSVFNKGTYYSILEDDYISKQNFSLLLLVTAVQAVKQNPPPVPTIVVGPR